MSSQHDLDTAIAMARLAGALALKHFRAIDQLTIEQKGHQDLVSNADKEVETLIRAEIARHWPNDGIVGEEHGVEAGTSGAEWVIDPIDGTANFVRGIPQWCVSIARVRGGAPEIGVVYEPVSDEMFAARRGGGATVNGRPMRVAPARDLTEGSVGTGFSARIEAAHVVAAIGEIIAKGGVFFRNASGALMLAYVASGRLIGYIEEHMNSWDCMAALLMVEEAGGVVLPLDPATCVAEGGKIVAAGPGVYPEILGIAERTFGV